ncbi:hypothetical protein MHU86_25291 [Fragilaria crotonensis]|nr:hypothetical protein MHU86_25291 [Fragilaria crotonensis]
MLIPLHLLLLTVTTLVSQCVGFQTQRVVLGCPLSSHDGGRRQHGFNSKSNFVVTRAPHTTTAGRHTLHRPITSVAVKTNSNTDGGGSENSVQDDYADIKAELTKYLAYREQVGADEAMKKEAGKIVGGTKGNVVLDYVSGSPNKEITLEMPNIFDYSELDKYGFGYLVKPIMESGGRLEMYKLMGLRPPVNLVKEKVKAPPLVIDRTGEQDKGRYTGLKIGLLTDDSMMEDALQRAKVKAQSGERMRPAIAEEEYQQPFADKRNVGPQQTPLWTPDKLDEEGRKLGRASDWARQAKAGAFIQDPAEILAIDGGLRVYSIITSLFIAFAFGHVTEGFIDALHLDPTLQGALQPPSLTIVVANIGSSIFAYTKASDKNRSKFVWGVKGLLGGPVAVFQLSGLNELRTRAEQEQTMRDTTP